MEPKEFIDWLIPKTKNNVVLQSLLIAQICLESAFGKKHFHNNYLGIKCHKGVKCRDARTKEYVNGSYRNYRLSFAVYDSIDDCIADYLSILSRERYREVRQARNYIEATEAIRQCGYATSPSYTKNLRKIIEKYHLYILDWKEEPEMKLTKNFEYGEFWSGSIRGIKIEPPEEYFERIKRLAGELQKVRDVIRRPIIVTSGYRTKTWNKIVGGVPNSFHTQALAVDSRAVGMLVTDYAIYLARYTNFMGFGVNIKKNFVHADLRKKFTVFKY